MATTPVVTEARSRNNGWAPRLGWKMGAEGRENGTIDYEEAGETVERGVGPRLGAFTPQLG